MRRSVHAAMATIVSLSCGAEAGEDAAAPQAGAGEDATDAAVDANKKLAAKKAAAKKLAAEQAAAEQAAQLKADSKANASPPTPEPPPPIPVIERAPGPLLFEPMRGPGGKLPYDFEPAAAATQATGTGGDPAQEAGETGLGTGELVMPPGRSRRWSFGWTADSEVFAYCAVDMSREGGLCQTYGADGRGESFEPARWDQFEEANGPLDRGAAQWPYGDVTITYTRIGTRLMVGGRARESEPGGKPDVVVFSFDSEWYFGTEGELGLGIVSVSPDGGRVAFVVAGVAGGAHTQMQAEVTTTAAFAAAVYAGRGAAHLRASQFADAVAWYSRAAEVSEAWIYAYREACARARGGHDGTEAALAAALERGGDQARRKAATDADLANVRAQGWFKALVG